MADMVGLICQANSRLVSVGTGNSTQNATSRNGIMQAARMRVGRSTRSCRDCCELMAARCYSGPPVPDSGRLIVSLFLDRPADAAQVFAEGERGLLPPLPQVGLESHLLAQWRPGPHPLGLAAFDVPDRLGDAEQLAGSGSRQEQ